MAYDEELADRIRALVGEGADVTEKKMFGGLAFLIAGNMSVAAIRRGGLMVRVAPEESDSLIAGPHVRPVEMRGRELRGWLEVDAEALRAGGKLEVWVRRGVEYARSLPPKR